MKALVTGATGFVGFHVARQLQAEGVFVRLLARPASQTANLHDLNPGMCEVVTGDLVQPHTLQEAVKNCSRVYHVAADYRLWAPDPQELYLSNVNGTRNLLEAARAAGVERVVYTSTVGALGHARKGDAADEDTPVLESDMIGHYKRSKFLAEEAAREYAAAGLDVVIVNPSTPIGDHDRKPTPTGKIIVDFLNGRLPAYVDTGLNLIAVEDVAAGILLAADKGVRGRRYILGNRNTSLCEMLQMLAAVTGLPAPRIKLPYAAAWAAVGAENLAARVVNRPPAHPFEGVKMARHAMYFSAERACRELGLPQTSVEQALKRAAHWFAANGYVKQEARKQAALAVSGREQ